MGLCLFFLPNFPGAMFIQGATFIPDSRVSVHEKGTFMPFYCIDGACHLLRKNGKKKWKKRV